MPVLLFAAARVRQDPRASVQAREHPHRHAVRQPVTLAALRGQKLRIRHAPLAHHPAALGPCMHRETQPARQSSDEKWRYRAIQGLWSDQTSSSLTTGGDGCFVYLHALILYVIPEGMRKTGCPKGCQSRRPATSVAS